MKITMEQMQFMSISLIQKNDEYLDAKITRYPEEIICYVNGLIINNVDTSCFNVFECTSYDDALKYLEGYFETSSKMFDNE